MVLDRELLLKQGFLHFNLKEIDEELYNKLYTEFNQKPISTKNWSFRYEKKLEIESETEIRDTISKLTENCEKARFSMDESTSPHSAMIRLLIEGEDFDKLHSIQKHLDSYKSFNNGQNWYFKNKIPFNREILKEVFDKTIITDLYNEDIIDKTKYSEFEHIYRETDFTLYVKNNFIEEHADAEDSGRLCVFLMYLSDDYKDGYGGEIVVNKSVKITPEFGNIVILDFTKHNLNHEVLAVTEPDFKRYAIINFLYQ